MVSKNITRHLDRYLIYPMRGSNANSKHAMEPRSKTLELCQGFTVFSPESPQAMTNSRASPSQIIQPWSKTLGGLNGSRQGLVDAIVVFAWAVNIETLEKSLEFADSREELYHDVSI